MANTDDFRQLLTRLAAAWNTADPESAVRCFTADVVYVEPPDRQRYVGHEEIYDLSAAVGMSITWHHIAFDPGSQIGFAEYTFRGRNQYHGVAVIQCADGRIRRWREYQRPDDLSWQEFAGDSIF